MSSRGVLEALYCAAPWCLQRVATSVAGEETMPPGPRGLIEARCQYRGEGGKRVSVRYPPFPYGRGVASSFYRPMGGTLQSCRTNLATCGGMVYSATEWTAVLVNLASGRASLRVLHSSSSGFEGNGVEASLLIVVRASARGSG
jgi:hypothetical protein